MKGMAVSKNVHMMLQGKGGVGKSTCTVFLAQYLARNGVEFQGVDTDPVNQSFSAFKSLPVRHLELLEQGNVKQRRFDSLIEEIVSGDKDYVIDNGASSFIPLASYIAENKIFDLLERNGVTVYLHTPVVSGAAMVDSLSGMKAIADMTARKNLVVWKNGYFGSVVQGDIALEEMKVFKNSSKSIMGVVDIPVRTEDTYGVDLKKMLSMGLTFDECIEGKEFMLVQRERIKNVREEIYAEIGKVGGDEWIHKT